MSKPVQAASQWSATWRDGRIWPSAIAQGIRTTAATARIAAGQLRRRASAVMLRSLRVVSLEQSLPGRVLGYGTLQAGPLEVEYVPNPGRVRDLVERLAA